MSTPPKRARTEDPAAIPAAVETVIKRLIPSSEDVTDVDFREYALVFEGIWGHGTSVSDFGSRVWLVPDCCIAYRTADRNGVYSFKYNDFDVMPPELLEFLQGEMYKLNLGGPDQHSANVSLIFTWAARTQLGNMIIVERANLSRPFQATPLD
tara:strand:- start:8255 stop:8713 length:459 start_codon:yes stop_codon:yes gene_type:complete